MGILKIGISLIYIFNIIMRISYDFKKNQIKFSWPGWIKSSLSLRRVAQLRLVTALWNRSSASRGFELRPSRLLLLLLPISPPAAAAAVSGLTLSRVAPTLLLSSQ